jgi:nitrate reductase NapE component
MTLLGWLQKPYPIVHSTKAIFVLGGSYGLFVVLFLLIFKPFGMERVIGNQYVFSGTFGLITSGCALTTLIILPQFATKFVPQGWRIQHEILFILLNLLLISAFNYQYSTTLSVIDEENRYSIFTFLFMTFTTSIFPISIVVFITEYFLSRKYVIKSDEINRERSLKSEVTSDKVINIVAKSVSDNMSLREEDLLYIKSEENYCSINYLEKDNKTAKLIRISMTNIENQLVDYPQVIRCHRSYIVNKRHVSKISGNARGYVLHLNGNEGDVPVSRSFPKEELS